jgi:cation:H+ antiporter
MNALTLVLFVLGLVLLVVGAEALVKGASRLAAAFGITPLVIGLTVVAFGTSAPEMAVSVKAAFDDAPDVAIGNVIGSNIANILLILGLSAAITPLIVAAQIIRLDLPIMIVLSGLVWWFAVDGAIDRTEGFGLALGLVVYVAIQVVMSRRESGAVKAEYAAEYAPPTDRGKSTIVQLGWIVLGLGLLVLGSHWLVEGATVMARSFGVSELVIGLTVVAVGTSLPEIATSIVAALRGERDIAVGNVVGSNIFNILSVLGISASVAPHGIPVSPDAQNFDLPVMVAIAVVCLPIFVTGLVARWQGLLFIAYYALYTTYLVLHAMGHEAMPAFRDAMLGWVLPLTGAAIVAQFVWWFARRGSR